MSNKKKRISVLFNLSDKGTWIEEVDQGSYWLVVKFDLMAFSSPLSLFLKMSCGAFAVF